MNPPLLTAMAHVLRFLNKVLLPSPGPACDARTRGIKAGHVLPLPHEPGANWLHSSLIATFSTNINMHRRDAHGCCLLADYDIDLVARCSHDNLPSPLQLLRLVSIGYGKEEASKTTHNECA